MEIALKVNAACQQAAGRSRWGRTERVRLVLLRVLAGVSQPFVPGPRPLGPAPRLLVIRPDHLGDLLFATPALQALRESLPAAHITALVGPWGQEIMARNPHLDTVRTCAFPWFDRQPRPSLLAPYRLLWREAAALRTMRFDAALNLRPDFWWGAVLAYLAHIPVRLGYDVPACRPFLTTAVPLSKTNHDAERNLTLVTVLTGAARDQTRERWGLIFEPAEEERSWAARTLPGVGWLAVVPGAGTRAKQWTSTGWAQVINALTRTWGLQTVMVGGPAEVGVCRAIAGQVADPPLVLAGETTLGQLAALFGRCRLVVGIDSGPLNLAVAQGVPTVHLFGPADPAQFGPWGQAGRHVVVQAPLPCVPCRKLDWPLAEGEVTPCLAAIAPADVVAAAGRLLGESLGG